MKDTSARLTYFDISECGFYGHSSQKNKDSEDSIEFIFKSIFDWLKCREELQDTTPWPESRVEQYPKKPICYCNSFYYDQETGDYFFVFWRAAVSLMDKKTLWGIPKRSKVGDSVVKEKSIGSDDIWGRPSYYWVIPNKKVVASVKLDTSICDKEMFVDWVTGCIQYKADIPDKKRQETKDGFRIYFEDTQNGHSYKFKFDIHMKMLGTLDAKLEKLAPDVKSIVLRQTVAVKQSNDLAWLPQVIGKYKDSFGNKSNTRRVELTYETKLSAKQMKETILQYNQEAENILHNEWDTLGFRMKEGRTVFVDEYRATGKIILGTATSKIINAQELWRVLHYNRKQLLEELEFSGLSQDSLQKSEEEFAMESRE